MQSANWTVVSHQPRTGAYGCDRTHNMIRKSLMLYSAAAVRWLLATALRKTRPGGRFELWLELSAIDVQRLRAK